MWIVRALVCLCALAGTAQSEPLGWLNDAQRNALGQLYKGYTDSFFCQKKIDLDAAGRFLAEKLGNTQITPAGLAEISLLVLIIQGGHTDELVKKGDPKKVVPEHCKEVMSRYGPDGTMIPGLLTEVP